MALNTSGLILGLLGVFAFSLIYCGSLCFPSCISKGCDRMITHLANCREAMLTIFIHGATILV
jgi:hypothetical protein